MRLHVAERPLRRQFRKAGDAGVLAHDHERVARRHDEDVERGAGGRGRELAVRAGEVEGAVRVMDEHAPPVGADQPLDRRARAVGLQLVAALAVAHAIGLALAIELRAALTETEERPLRQEERHVRRLRVEHQPLHGHAGGRLDVERRRLRGEAHGQVARRAPA